MKTDKSNRYASELATAITGKLWPHPEYEAVRSMVIGLQARGVMFDALGPPPSLAEIEEKWRSTGEAI